VYAFLTVDKSHPLLKGAGNGGQSDATVQCTVLWWKKSVYCTQKNKPIESYQILDIFVANWQQWRRKYAQRNNKDTKQVFLKTCSTDHFCTRYSGRRATRLRGHIICRITPCVAGRNALFSTFYCRERPQSRARYVSVFRDLGPSVGAL